MWGRPRELGNYPRTRGSKLPLYLHTIVFHYSTNTTRCLPPLPPSTHIQHPSPTRPPPNPNPISHQGGYVGFTLAELVIWIRLTLLGHWLLRVYYTVLAQIGYCLMGMVGFSLVNVSILFYDYFICLGGDRKCNIYLWFQLVLVSFLFQN